MQNDKKKILWERESHGNRQIAGTTAPLERSFVDQAPHSAGFQLRINQSAGLQEIAALCSKRLRPPRLPGDCQMQYATELLTDRL